MATFTSELWLNIISRTTDPAAASSPFILCVYVAAPVMIYIDAVRRELNDNNPERWCIAAMLPGVWLFAVIGYLITRNDPTTTPQHRTSLSYATFLIRLTLLLLVDLSFIYLDQVMFDYDLGLIARALI